MYSKQVINYLKATDKPLGLSVSFGHHLKIEHERFVHQSSRAAREDFSRLSDRFVPSGYTDDYGFERKLEMLASIDGIEGIGIEYPCPPFKSGAELRTVLERHGLAWAISDADIYTERRFKHGSNRISHHKSEEKCCAWRETIITCT